MRTDAIATLTTFLLLSIAPLGFAQQPRTGAGAIQERATTPASSLETAEGVLEALEDGDVDLRTFDSGVAYTTISDLGGALIQRVGTIAFASDTAEDGAPRRRFAVEFDSLRRGERYLTGEAARQLIAFDGRWLWDKIYSEQQVNKREIVRQGETIDPFELGDGPFPPLPIGQQKDEILRRYDVRLVPWNESLTPDPDLDPSFPDEKREIEMATALMKFAEGAVQLRLVPKQSAGDSRFSEIRLWYKPDEDGRLLPRMSRTVDASSRDVSIVQLMHPLRINGPAREDLLQITVDDEWMLTETRLPPAEEGRTTRTTPQGTP